MKPYVKICALMYLHIGICIKEKSGRYAKIGDGDFLEVWNLGQFLLLCFYFSVLFIFYNKSSL